MLYGTVAICTVSTARDEAIENNDTRIVRVKTRNCYADKCESVGIAVETVHKYMYKYVAKLQLATRSSSVFIYIH